MRAPIEVAHYDGIILKLLQDLSVCDIFSLGNGERFREYGFQRPRATAARRTDLSIYSVE